MSRDAMALDQRCLCGGTGRLVPAVTLQPGNAKHTGWAAFCTVCGAMTAVGETVEKVCDDWRARKCPGTAAT